MLQTHRLAAAMESLFKLHVLFATYKQYITLHPGNAEAVLHGFYFHYIQCLGFREGYVEIFQKPDKDELMYHELCNGVSTR